MATVAGTEIRGSQLDHWTAVWAAAEHRQGIRGAAPAPRSPALGFLIAAAWAEGEARRTGVAADRRQVARELSLVLYAQLRHLPAVQFAWEGQLRKLLVSSDATPADQLWLMRLSLLQGGLQRQRLALAERTVSRAQVASYYRTQRRRFIVPERRDIAIVESYSLRDMLLAKHALEVGESIAAVAKRFSIDPVAPTGLKLHVLRSEGAPRLAAAVFAARPHVLVGPLHVAMYYVFKVLSVRPARWLRLAEAEGAIRRHLASMQPSQELDRSFDRRMVAHTKCQVGYARDACLLAVRDLATLPLG